MKILGIDLSSMPTSTAASVMTWEGGRAVAGPPNLACTDPELAGLIDSTDVVGIDAPFGWPVEFAAAVASWPYSEWTKKLRDRLRSRETEHFVNAQPNGRTPLSVSTDLISISAMRAMSILKRFGVTDRSGDGRFFEVYPAAALRAWGIADKGYKGTGAANLAKRVQILGELRAGMPSRHLWG